MAKRSLCLLLAAAMMFSLAVPAFAEEALLETPAPTEEPVVTEAPVEVTEGPVATEAPVEATEGPVVMEEPVEVTEEPVVTEEAVVTEALVEVTEEPVEATEEPVVTEESVATEEPVEGTEAPVEVTEAPEPAEEPESAAVDEPAPAEEEAPTSGTCGSGVAWSLSGDGTLTISGSGAMDDYSSDSGDDLTPWRDLRDQVRKVVVRSGVTGIGSFAFDRCDYLASIEIPASVTSIGENVFPTHTITDIAVAEGNTSYASVDGVLFSADKMTLVCYPCAKADAAYAIPDTVRTVGDGAFMYAINLTSVRIPDGVTAIGNSAFYWCLRLTDINIPSTVKTIGNYAFDTCKMTALEIPEGVVSIGEWAFHNSELASVTIPASVTSIGQEAFAAGNLKSVTVLNPNCVIGGESYKGEVHYSADHTLGYSADTAISGYAGSTAEAYANWWGCAFQPLASDPGPTPEPDVKPAKPAKPTVSNTTSGVKISWKAVKGAAKYRIYYKTGSSKSWKKLTDTKKTSYTWTKAKSGTKYTFTIKAYSAGGKASSYDKTGKSITYVKAPNAPTVKKVSNGIKITWSKVTGATKYRVYYKIGNGSWKTLVKSTTKRTYTWKAPKNGVKYTFTVKAYKGSASSAYNTKGKSITYKK